MGRSSLAVLLAWAGPEWSQRWFPSCCPQDLLGGPWRPTSLALSLVLIQREALGFLEDCKKKVDPEGEHGVARQLLCVTFPYVQASSLPLMLLAHAVHMLALIC